VGGIKEKVLAANRAGVTTVILPKKNEKDLEEVPESVKKEMKFHFAQKMDEVIDLALCEEPKAQKKRGKKKPSFRLRKEGLARVSAS